MGIRVCSDDDSVTFLYCSTSMRALPLEAFDAREAAESFLEYAAAKLTGDLRHAPEAVLGVMRAAWEKLPRCKDCGDRIVRPSANMRVCHGCDQGLS